MKYTGKFTVAIVSTANTDGGCAYPAILSKDGEKRVRAVRVDDGGHMACWTMEEYDYSCDCPQFGDSFSFALPCSKAEGVITGVEVLENGYTLEIEGTVEGAYNSIFGGNPVGGVTSIPLEEWVETTQGGSMQFRAYVAERIVKYLRRNKESIDIADIRSIVTYLNSVEVEVAQEMIDGDISIPKGGRKTIQFADTVWDSFPLRAPAWAC